ncbi:MAG: LVIVD repeat-containing protein [Actinomycetota bacterium]
MRPIRTAALVSALLVVLLPAVGNAGPDAVAHGITSANVEHIRFVPFEEYSATGARLVGKYLYLTSWRNMSIYDVSNPEDPQLVSYTPWALPTTTDTTPDPHRFENEDVATDGKILIFSETGATLVGGGFNRYRVYDVTNKAAPVQIANVEGIGQHTMTCVAECKYTYGSGGNIVDLTNPADPKLVANWRTITGAGNAHDVREVAPGLVAVSSGQGQIFDTSDPVNPKIVSIAGAGNAKPAHSNTWPNGTDKFLLGASETNLQPQCNGTTNGATTTWDMSTYLKGTYDFIDVWRGDNGILFDGSPPANALGCSAHWLEASPAFHNGGVFAQGYYEHGSRFFYVNGAGKLRQVGYFVPFGGSTSAVHWITDRIVYAIDYTRGIDIIRWNGALPADPDSADAITQLNATAGGAVSGTATFLGESTPNVIAEDPPNDGPGGANSAPIGIDITKVSVSQPDATYPELVATWDVSALPNPVTGMQPENVRYVWSFLAGGKTWFVQAKASAIAQSTTPDDPTGTITKTTRAFQLRGNCGVIPGDPVPVGITSCGHLAWLDGSFDAEATTVSVRVPLGASFAPEIASGAVLKPVTSGGTADIYAALQVAADAPQTRDVVTYETEWTVPQSTVALGTAPVGTDPSTVTYGAPVVVGPDGAFSKNLGPIAAGQAVFAKACFGNTCSYRSVAV